MTDSSAERTTISYGDLFFYMFFALMFGMRMWGIYESKALYAPLLVVGMIFWAISAVLARHSLFEWIMIAALMALSGLVYIKTGEKGLILYFALMLGMKNIDSKRLFKVGVFAGMSGLICLTYLSSFSLIEDVAYIQKRSLVGEVFRRSLGFAHPNTLSSSFAILTMMIMYIVGYENKKRVWRATALMSAVAIYLFVYSGSRTGLLITLGYLFLNLIYTYRKKTGIIERVVLILLFPVLWILSIVGPALATPDTIAIVRKIDYNLGSRWDVGRYYLNNNSITLLGQRLNNQESNVYGIDMSQLYLLLQLGVIVFVVINILWLILICDEVRENRLSELVIVFVTLIMGITDPFLYNLGFKNLAFVFMGIVLYKYIGKISEKLPEALTRPVVLSDKTRELELPLPQVATFENAGTMKPGKFLAPVSFLIPVIMAVIAMVVYVATPSPDYVLSDRNSAEQSSRLIKGLEGSCYSEQEINDIKSQGNFVLNYTDENELMYVYYSDESDSIPGGHFSPNAAAMEKVRRSISIFFWGSIIGVFVIKLVYSVSQKEAVKRQ